VASLVLQPGGRWHFNYAKAFRWATEFFIYNDVGHVNLGLRWPGRRNDHGLAWQLMLSIFTPRRALGKLTTSRVHSE